MLYTYRVRAHGIAKRGMDVSGKVIASRGAVRYGLGVGHPGPAWVEMSQSSEKAARGEKCITPVHFRDSDKSATAGTATAKGLRPNPNRSPIR